MMSLGYVRNHLNSEFRGSSATTWNIEQGIEFNVPLDISQKVFASASGSILLERRRRITKDLVVGFRTKVEF
jgi:hypothetical protein